MRNLRLILAYDGTDFHGWQRQPRLPTIQEGLESAIGKIIGEPVAVYGSGRTDAGVHAASQVANFATVCRIPCENLLKALNDALPQAVRVRSVESVSRSFHARYDARSKTYRYRILQTAFCSPFVGRFVWHYPFALNRRQMAEAAGFVEGEHDFTSFAGSAGQGSHDSVPSGESGSRVRTVFASRILWRDRSQMLVYEVRGNGFLQHMVRNIVGTLVEVGQGRRRPRDMVAILEARDRRRAGPTAPAQGLCLMRVEY